MLAWYSDHFISQKIILRHAAPGWKAVAKHTSLFTKENRNKFKDEALLYGILRGCSDVIHHNFKNGLDYLHIDHGYIGRSKTHMFNGYYRVSLNDTQAHYKDVNLPSDRAKKLEVTLKDWQDNQNGLVLIIPPTPAMEVFYGIDIDDWTKTTIKKIKELPYKVRTKLDTVPLDEDLRNAKCVITFNSNTAVDATLQGIPVIATSQHSVIRDWNKLKMEDVRDCYEKSVDLDRQKLINFISYHQFTLEEMERGIAAAIVKEMRKRNVY